MPLPGNNPRTPIIEFENVSFSYSNTPVLRQVSFQIFPNESIGMIGPNGGGKSTLLKLILGLLKPSQGSIKLSGSKSQTPHIAYVPQSFRFDRDFPISVEEIVLSGLLSRLPWYGHFHSKEKKAAREILDRMELGHLYQAPFGTLSGGQAQRVFIARALVSEPELLLLDEPTASVDNQAEADIYAILSKLKNKITVLMVTHDLQAAVDHVDRILCVQGKVTPLKIEEVCKHFAVGLYHLPITKTSSNPL